MRDDERDEAVPEARPAEGREVELKLEVPSGDLAVLKRHALVRALARSRPQVQRLRTVYFDTPELDLGRQRLALRVRTSGKRHVQTLKDEGASLGGLFVRGEWEARLPGAEPDVERIASFEARARVRRATEGKSLEPVFETEFRRTRYRLSHGDSELFLDFNEGEIRARRHSLPIREIELELRRGDPGVLYGIALELHEALPLRLSVESKADRGYALATGARPSPERAPRVELPAGATLEEALRAILAAGLDQVLANQGPAREGTDPEGIHQLRVGLRRTRAALALFRDALPAEQTASFKSELRWFAGELGPARDLDVFLEETLEPLAARFPDDAGLKRVRDAARELRDEAYGRARAAIDAPRSTALLLALGGWLVARAWRGAGDAEARAAWASPAAELGTALLERRFKKARKLGRDLARRTDAERHRLRIELKKLRYAGEFLGSLFAAAGVERTLRRLTELQDALGSLNDVATAERLLDAIGDRLGREWQAEHERAAGFITGWASRESERRLAKLEKRWKAFLRAKPFWRS
jgi:inorganic triphosphatase YgiF